LTSGPSGTTITWVVTNTYDGEDASTIITVNGKVTRPTYESGNAEITLTATIIKGNENEIKEFTVTVIHIGYICDAPGDCRFPYSCRELLIANPGIADGVYTLEKSSDSDATTNISCNMTLDGGGWSIISFENFDSGTATGWTDNRISTDCSAFGNMLGGYNLFAGMSIQKTFDLLEIPHTEAYVYLKYFIIDSWEGEQARVYLGGSMIFDQSFTSSGSDVCGGPWGDQSVDISGTLPHSANTLNLQATSTLDQLPDDESWGISDVQVKIR